MLVSWRTHLSGEPLKVRTGVIVYPQVEALQCGHFHKAGEVKERWEELGVTF